MPTSPATDAGPAPSRRQGARDRTGGFALIETMLALVVIGLIALLALPRGLAGSTTGTVRSTALKVASLVRVDRNAALRSGRPVATILDTSHRILRAGASGAVVDLSAIPVLVRPADLSGFRFMPDGTSSGGTIVLGSGAKVYRIAVNPVTAGVDVDAVLAASPRNGR